MLLVLMLLHSIIAQSVAGLCGSNAKSADDSSQTADQMHPLLLMLLPQHYGMNKSVAVLRGSKAKSVDDWMKEAKAADGSALYGAGCNRSGDWWKGLGNVLLGEGFLASQSKKVGAAAVISISSLCLSVWGAQSIAGSLHMRRGAVEGATGEGWLDEGGQGSRWQRAVWRRLQPQRGLVEGAGQCTAGGGLPGKPEQNGGGLLAPQLHCRFLDHLFGRSWCECGWMHM
jgi:hypothetical protein